MTTNMTGGSTDESAELEVPGENPQVLRTIGYQVAGVLVGWAVLVSLAGYAGAFLRVPPLLFGTLVVCAIATVIAAYARNRALQEWVDTLPIPTLTLFHVWRVGAAWAFFAYGKNQLLPPAFVRNAGWGDLIVGLLALVVVAWPRRKAIPLTEQKRWLVFHMFSIADFVVAVGTGIVFTALQVPLMPNLRSFPVVIIPAFGVCVTGPISVMVLARIFRYRQAKRS